ncbi:protein of unknown function [Sinosporangium album]|uniref:DUF4429 domain-containing protein n=1 Tax=Sinosporangium album TaxID=504805 RepID=A0A1G7ZCX3_9ACTN|nr:DUF4429 domain-containing protein [Sinosporangium album]SDH06534.1 protein of unknown function [Sinosporangium album]
MAEVIGRDGIWTFDGERIRVVPNRKRHVPKLRRALGEVSIPLPAVAGVAYEPGRKGGALRLRLREGADPLLQVAAGRLGDADPYQLAPDPERTGVAEYFVDEVRHALLIEQVPEGPADRYLLPGPQVPASASVGDGTVSFDGELINFEWNWTAIEPKKAAGPQRIPVGAVAGVEWVPLAGGEDGRLCFLLKSGHVGAPSNQELACLRWSKWGIEREGGTTVLVAAAVAARLPHPFNPSQPALTPGGAGGAVNPGGAGADPDVMLRRLRELGELHREGTLTDEEFTLAKQVLLRRMADGSE